jgi:hypothetical protein
MTQVAGPGPICSMGAGKDSPFELFADDASGSSPNASSCAMIGSAGTSTKRACPYVPNGSLG